MLSQFLSVFTNCLLVDISRLTEGTPLLSFCVKGSLQLLELDGPPTAQLQTFYHSSDALPGSPEDHCWIKVTVQDNNAESTISIQDTSHSVRTRSLSMLVGGGEGDVFARSCFTFNSSSPSPKLAPPPPTDGYFKLGALADALPTVALPEADKICKSDDLRVTTADGQSSALTGARVDQVDARAVQELQKS